MKKYVTLLDGGMGQELVLRAKRLGAEIHPLWSAKVLIEKPSLVLNLHREFLEAGATVLTVSSYSVTRHRLKEYGMEDQFLSLQEKAVSLANQAKEEYLAEQKSQGKGVNDIKIAACLSPVASYMPNIGDTYGKRDLISLYTEIARAQVNGVDLFLCETMGSIFEASCALIATQQFGKPAWCALTVNDDDTCTLRSGEPLYEAVQTLEKSFPELNGILLNCSKPEAIDFAMETLIKARKNKDIEIGAYPNAFKSVENLMTPELCDRNVGKLESRDDFKSDKFVDISLKWAYQGATILGGCCEIKPNMIEALYQKLQKEDMLKHV